MRRKPLPPPPDDLEGIRAAQAAVPLVPGSEDDCCARLQGRLALGSRDTAATWLDFLRGLGLVEVGPAGFSRADVDPDAMALAERFLDSVVGASEARAVLAAADRPLDVDAVAGEIEGAAGPWERRRRGADWPDFWRSRTADLLEWLVRFGVARRVNGGYRPTDSD